MGVRVGHVRGRRQGTRCGGGGEGVRGVRGVLARVSIGVRGVVVCGGHIVNKVGGKNCSGGVRGRGVVESVRG